MLNGDMGREQNVQMFISDLIEKGHSPATLAELADVSERTIYYWIDGARVPSRKAVNLLAEALGMKAEFIYSYGDESKPGEILESDSDFIPIPYLEQMVAGGTGGTDPVGKRIKSYLAFNRQWIYSKGNPNKMVVFRVVGDSMSPAIPDGSIVLVNEESNTISNGKVYVVTHNNSFKTKRLYFDRDNDKIRMSSDDGMTPDDFAQVGSIEDRTDFEVIGKVIWVGYELS